MNFFSHPVLYTVLEPFTFNSGMCALFVRYTVNNSSGGRDVFGSDQPYGEVQSPALSLSTCGRYIHGNPDWIWA